MQKSADKNEKWWKWSVNTKLIRNGTQTQLRINIRRQSVNNRRLYQIKHYNFDSAMWTNSIWPSESIWTDFPIITKKQPETLYLTGNEKFKHHYKWCIYKLCGYIHKKATWLNG